MNKEIVKKAIDMYKELLVFIGNDKQHAWKSLYNIIKIGNNVGDDEIFSNTQIERMGQIITENISIETNKGAKVKLNNLDLKILKKKNSEFWELCNKWNDFVLPLEEEHGEWAKQLSGTIAIPKFTEKALAEYIQKNIKEINTLSESLTLKDFTVYEWLDDFYKIITDTQLYKEFGIVLNKSGKLLSVNEIKYSNDIEDTNDTIQFDSKKIAEYCELIARRLGYNIS